TRDDLRRIEEVATVGKVPANREVLEIVPYSYRLDGQDNIKDPLGMTGTRLEISANVVSALGPYVQNLQKSAEMAKVAPRIITPGVLAAARAVLSESQMENGVAVVDLGGATTSVAVYEDGDLQYIGVVPVGGNNITNDLAIGLKTDPDIAEKVKLRHAVAIPRDNEEGISIKDDTESYSFSSRDIDEIVEARLEEIFEAVQKELKKAGRAGKLPSGVVLTGGTANIKHVADFAKDRLGLAARIGKAGGYGGVADDIEQPEYATAIGLMLIDSEDQPTGFSQSNGFMGGAGNASHAVKEASGMVAKFLKRFKA
ncbi:MAG TPA: cell division protein FtsA, partial [Candidatus Saccharimonadaceae bacterium]|nr:cell division protein FtsA [Candidatus Saccharimonadaceae bacterium]